MIFLRYSQKYKNKRKIQIFDFGIYFRIFAKIILPRILFTTKQISKMLGKILSSITALLLVLAIFLANTGFVLSSHSCKMRGEKTNIHFFSAQNTHKNKLEDKCCSKKSLEIALEKSENQQSEEKDKCCSFSSKYIKADIQQDMPIFGIDFVFVSPIILENFIPKILVERVFYVKRKALFAFYNKPPPIANRILLCLYSILRI